MHYIQEGFKNARLASGVSQCGVLRIIVLQNLGADLNDVSLGKD